MSPRQLHRRTIGAQERGAVLIHVALVLTVLCGFCAMSIDYGLLMVARSQVQTAADAGALAGAVALGFDEPFDISEVKQSAIAVADVNLVAQYAANVTPADVQADSWFVSGLPPPGPTQPPVMNRVAVSAYRNPARGNALPTFFGRMVGIGDQGVRATATAMMVPSNASDCVWPIAIPDRWQDNNIVAGAPAPTFVRYDNVTGPPTLAAPPDVYLAPSFTPPFLTTAGSGFALPPRVTPMLPVRFDRPLILTNPTPMDFTQPTAPGRFVPVQVPRHDGGGFADNLASCNSSDEPVAIGDDDRLRVEPAGTLGTVLAAAAGRYAADSTATWNPTTFRVEGSCAGVFPCGPMSPRLVVLPLFDLNRYENTRWVAGVPGATPKIRVVNFVGFFITRVTGTSIEGQLTSAPGRLVIGKPMVGYASAFLRTAYLSR